MINQQLEKRFFVTKDEAIMDWLSTQAADDYDIQSFKSLKNDLTNKKDNIM